MRFFKLKFFLPLFIFALWLGGCSTMNYQKTVEQVDLQKFMGPWYVLGGRFTFLEADVFNGVEDYLERCLEHRRYAIREKHVIRVFVKASRVYAFLDNFDELNFVKVEPVSFDKYNSFDLV